MALFAFPIEFWFVKQFRAKKTSLLPVSVCVGVYVYMLDV